MRWTFSCDKKIGCFCVVVLLAACAARTSDANRVLASNLLSELQDLLVEQKNFNREIEKVGASASDLARQKSVLTNHPQYSSMLKKILQWKAKRLADPARATFLDAQLLVEMSEDETQVYLKRLELYEKSGDLYAATSNFRERDRQLNEHRRKLYLSIRDRLDSIVLNKMNEQFTVLSQEETAEVQRRVGLIQNLTDDFVTLGDWEK
jgi:hypothetical protein